MERDLQSMAPSMVPTKRRLILGVLAVLLLVFLYRVFAVYTVRSGECRPRPVPTSPDARPHFRSGPAFRPSAGLSW